MSEVKSVTPKEVYQLFQDGHKPRIIDVRTDEEFKEARAACVTDHMPLHNFDPESLGENRDSKLYFICRSGKRSFDAASQCIPYGFNELYNIEGGTIEWAACQLPLEQGE